MKIFFRNIPEQTKPAELADFVTPFLKTSFINLFKSKGEITKHSVVSQNDRENNSVRHHGLISIMPDVAGERLLKRLHHKSFKGRKIIIREFVDRTWENDRRNHQAKQKLHPQNELRCADRRQHELKTVTDFQISFSHQEIFARKYN